MNREISGRSYSFTLGDKTVWKITPTPNTNQWVDALAEIFQLDEFETHNREIVFLRDKLNGNRNGVWTAEHFNDFLIQPLSSATWHSRTIQGIKYAFDEGATQVFCDIGAEEAHNREIAKMRHCIHFICTQAEGKGRFPFHGALIENRGKGIILTAPGGTGKSTSCKRLPGTWTVWSDDESLVVKQGPGNHRVHPFPTWSSLVSNLSRTTWHTQRHLPLSAIFFLEQSGRNEILPVNAAKAAILCNASTTSYFFRSTSGLEAEELRGFHNQLFRNACEISTAVPTYILRASLNGRFWEQMEKVLDNIT
jgi:SynChlorMet cassette protein ScmC